MSIDAKFPIYNFDFSFGPPSQFEWHRTIDGVAESKKYGYSRLDTSALPDWALKHLGPAEADLFDVAMATNISDRLALRSYQGNTDSAFCWSRTIQIRLAIREVERWRDPEVQRRLQNYLYINTGDKWQFEFVPLAVPASQVIRQEYLQLDLQDTLRRRYPEVRVSLFSDGVDSLSGLAYQLNEYPQSRIVLISFNTSNCITARQGRMLDELPHEMRERITHIPLSLKVRAGKARQEKSLRSRGFMFLAAASAASYLLGRSEFFVWENGIGAFNLPFDRSQFIGHNTRAVHPRSLASFTHFLEALLGRPFLINNHFQFLTKGEVCRNLADEPWRNLISQSFTCGHRQRVKDDGHQHCGICNSCILRRQGLYIAGLASDDTTKYCHDLRHMQDIPLNKRLEWVKTNEQWNRIADVLRGAKIDGDGEEQTWLRILSVFRELAVTVEAMEKAQHISQDQAKRGILRLLRTYVAEGLITGPSVSQVLCMTPREHRPVSVTA